MRIRRASPLLLLLAPSLVSATANRYAASIDSPPQQRRHLASSQDPDIPLSSPHRFDLRKRAEVLHDGAAAAAIAPAVAAGDDPAAAAAVAKSQQTKGPYKGTEDAPVDGLDGKPHAGPFVDTSPEDPSRPRSRKAGSANAKATASDKSVPTSLSKFAEGSRQAPEGWRLEDIPEKLDGVMNDENRVAPKKGTDGTAGGISEKEKERKLKGVGMGALENKPQEPKEAPPLPHSEEERIEREHARVSVKSNPKVEAVEGAAKQGYGSGGYGLEKPSDLPDSPHKPSTGSAEPDRDGPPIDGSASSWLTDTMPYTEGRTNKNPVSKPPSSSSSGSIPALVPSSDSDTWHEWVHSFVLSLTMILFSEIGDKTFLIAALMAMRYSRLLVFSAAFAALILMTVLSAILGHTVPTLLPKRFTTLAAALLFLVFGARMLKEGLAMPASLGVGEEMKEVEAELEEKEQELSRHHRSRGDHSSSTHISPYNLESGRGPNHNNKSLPANIPSPPASRSPSPPRSRLSIRPRAGLIAGATNLLSLVLSPAWVQTFIMTFLGEWGDRSQIATIAMAAGQDYWWVTLGAVTGHACCTGVAVIGGRALAGRVSLRVVTIGGAVAFLAFGVIYLYECLFDA